LRQVKYWLLGAILVMAAGGSLAFMFLDPITILVRGLANTISPLIEWPFRGHSRPLRGPGTVRSQMSGN